MYSDESVAVETDLFRNTFKYYKSRKPKPSLKELLTTVNSNKDQRVTEITKAFREDSRAIILGLRNPISWKIYSFCNHPGLLLIRNPFTSLGQRYWIKKCLEEYSTKPNKTNIDAEILLEDWWAKCFEDGSCNRRLQKKLRWCTLGYHHNWDTKIYSDDNRSPFPEDLAELSDVVANYVGCESFKAEAAIVNYYHRDSTLSPHTDHSEVNLDAPLFSFSFGLPAIFLIGGRDKSVAPSAIQLNSGDIVIMSKEARLCYHAVPKILETNDTEWMENPVKLKENDKEEVTFKYIKISKNRFISHVNTNLDNQEWMKLRNYVTESRINMNVRQVLHENQTSLQYVS